MFLYETTNGFEMRQLMDEMSYVEKLMMFGLTRQEASIYLCLNRNGTLTGYEASKLTGISRSNVYNALAGLTEKGAAYLMKGSSSKYMAVSVEEFCDNKLRMLESTRQWLAENGVQEKTYYYWLRRVRKEVYSQLSDGSTSLPAMQEKGTVTFAEVPMIPQQNPEIPFSFQPAVVIKTSHATVAVSNEVSDRLLTRLLQEVSNA